MVNKDLHDQGEADIRRDDDSGVNKLVQKQNVVPHLAFHGVDEFPDRFDCGEGTEVSWTNRQTNHVFSLVYITSDVCSP